MKHGDQGPSILFLCDYQAPYGGNFLASMARLDAAVKARGGATQYVFPAGAKDRPWFAPWTGGGRAARLLPEGSLPAQVKELTGLIDDFHADILHVHFGYFPQAELAALLRPKLRLILHYHSDFSAGKNPGPGEKLRAGLRRVMECLIGRDRVTKITVSEASARTTSDCLSIHNALVPERFTQDTLDRQAARAMLGVAPGKKLVLVFGWSPYIKGVDVAVRAVRRLWAAGDTAHLLGVVCGRSYTREKMAAYILEKTGSAPEDGILLLEPVEDVFRYHLASDIFLSASRSETFSYALLEALYTGRPCLISDIPGVRWAKGYESVLSFPTGDDAALAKSIGQAARVSPEILSDVSRQVQAAYGIDEWVNALLRVYGMSDDSCQGSRP